MRLLNLDEYFDCIYCINLPYRVDRLRQFKKSNFAILGTKNIKIFKAIDGKDVTDLDWNYSFGALGCRLSHLAIYKDALKRQYSKILVLEDDVILSKKLRKKLGQLLYYTKDNWDMIYFGGTNYIKPYKIKKGIIKLNGTLALHAVAINCRCLPKIINNIEADKRWVDSVIGDLHAELKVYGFSNPVAVQRAGFSDIQYSYVNYNTKFFNKIIYNFKQIAKVILTTAGKIINSHKS